MKSLNCSGTSDPYVRIFLLDQPTNFQETKVHSRNLNPKFHQILSIKGKSLFTLKTNRYSEASNLQPHIKIPTLY